MATKRSRKKQHDPANDLLENPAEIAERLGRGEEFVKNNSKILSAVLGVGILAIAVILYFQINEQNQNSNAQEDMFQAVYFFEQDSVQFALNGDGINAGFLQIVDDYKGTDAANLAHYYIGSIYMSELNFTDALTHLEQFSSDDYLVQAKAYSLIGDANLELGNTQEAISNYEKAADYQDDKYFTPKYLSKLAIAYEEAGQLDDAIAAYQRIEDEFFESFEFAGARKHKARLEGLASN